MPSLANLYKFGCCALLLVLAVVRPGMTGEMSDEPVMDVGRFESMKADNPEGTKLMLSAMADTVFYAQESAGHAAICATPATLPGSKLLQLVDAELAAPSDPANPDYAKTERIALVLVNALKKAGACD
jgi:hypothetical protein